MSGTEKQDLRKRMRETLDAHAAELDAPGWHGVKMRTRQLWDSWRTARRVERFLVRMGPRGLAAYHPMPGELDMTGLMERLHLHHRWITALPCIPEDREDRNMVFARWMPGEALQEDSFGIQEPVKKIPITPEVLLVPLVAFDTQGGRLGYGKGYYDTTLAAVAADGATPLLIGIAHDFQQVAHVPTEPHDMPLDLIATPTRLLRARPTVTQS